MRRHEAELPYGRRVRNDRLQDTELLDSGRNNFLGGGDDPITIIS